MAGSTCLVRLSNKLFFLLNHLADDYKQHSELAIQPFSTCPERGRIVVSGGATIVTVDQLLHSGRANDPPTPCSCDQTVSCKRNPSGPARLHYVDRGKDRPLHHSEEHRQARDRERSQRIEIGRRISCYRIFFETKFEAEEHVTLITRFGNFSPIDT